MNKIYSKKYKIESTNNKYLLHFESLDMEIQKKLRITLTHIVNNKEFNFYIEKSLDEIINEFSFLNCNSTKDLIDYLSELTKKDEITIDQKYKLMYRLVFFVGDKYINFNMKRKVDKSEVNFKEIEDEIYNIYDKIIKLEHFISSQESKNEDLRRELQNQFKDIESRINFIYNNKNNGNKDTYCSENNIIEEKNIINSGNYSISEKENSEIFEINKADNKLIVNQLEKMKKKPILFKGECEYFISFNLKNNDTMITWTIKNSSNIINVYNMANDSRFKSSNEHQNKIDYLKYFYNDIENKEFIISLSKKDNYLIVWEIYNNNYNTFLNLIKKITKREAKINISTFCIFSNKKYSNEDNYLFIYDKDYNKNKNQTGIFYYKIDNNFNINIENNLNYSLIGEVNEIYHLDIYYDVNKILEGKLYLLNCNQNNIIVIEDPIGNNLNKISFKVKGISSHLYGLIIERKNNLELIESNFDGIYIWDIKDNKAPKLKLSFDGNSPFYINIWNDDYFWVASQSVPKLYEISEDKIIEKYAKNDCNRNSKIMKIMYNNNESIVGVDNEHNLSIWYTEKN